AEKIEEISSKRSNSLENIYTRIFRTKFENSHEAESDTIALMKCALNYGQDFIEYLNKHSIPLKE
ncbi:MAG: exodeoxyribonuclease III activity, partial [Paramarteilia canceri]